MGEERFFVIYFHFDKYYMSNNLYDDYEDAVGEYEEMSKKFNCKICKTCMADEKQN